MDLQSRKIEFVQDFLKLQSEEAISKLEKLLKKELNKRIEQSEADFKNNRYKKTSELLSKYK